MSHTIRLTRIGEHDLPLPVRQPGSAGYDLQAREKTLIYPGEVAAVGTGFAWEIETNPPLSRTSFGLIRDRSGLATRSSVFVVAGVVDGDYRGEVKVALRNGGESPFRVEPGSRIAQMVLLTALTPELDESEDGLAETARGAAGFGSTGR